MSSLSFRFTAEPSRLRIVSQRVGSPVSFSVAGSDTPNMLPRSDADAPSSLRGERDEAVTLAEKLFANKAGIKTLTSRIAMHLTDEGRTNLFNQIDELLDENNWTEGDNFINEESFSTLLRMLIYVRNLKKPSLTVSNEGNIAASWLGSGRRLTIEFLKQDIVRLVLYRAGNAEAPPETAAYQGALERLDAVLAPFQATNWYRNETT